ncbi:CAAD domain-containing protein [Kamptonema sp. UHCC 0994]|uniref:CAAD domain-containing protein n=1 Tax=Kamptonema sp. UHCC 0994 TaxID=3031329 RepID=UPI0023B8FD58|nr:CAAD domain-containing protein [Kamptonema sp. UHCC 0994]MDF0554544.1 CAAD domain-containing protein [Kamptonema sp. UHCC 0994]
MTQVDPSGETEMKTATAQVEVTLEKPRAIAALTPGKDSAAQLQQIKKQVISILSELPAYVSNFFQEYQKALITIGLIAAGGITIKVTLAVLDSLNDIPLLSTTFELVGMGYTGWFVYRYLLRASNRQELSAEVESLKEQILGK